MHEVSIAENMIEILNDQALEKGFTRITLINIEIGLLSHIEPAALSFCFQAVSKNTLAEFASLHITQVKAIGICADCQKQFEYQHLYDPCPYCCCYQVTIVNGDQMRIIDLLVE